MRKNVNFLLIFPCDLHSLPAIHLSHVNSDMSFDKFQEMSRICWASSYGFLLIDKDSKLNEGDIENVLMSFFSSHSRVVA